MLNNILRYLLAVSILVTAVLAWSTLTSTTEVQLINREFALRTSALIGATISFIHLMVCRSVEDKWELPGNREFIDLDTQQ